MDTKITVLDIFLFGASLQGVFLFVVLMIRGLKNNRKNYLFLGCLIFAISYYLFKSGISSSGFIGQFPSLVATGFLVVPFIPTLCYLYLTDLLELKIKTPITLLHWLFPLFQTVYWLPFFLSSSAWKFGVLNNSIETTYYTNYIGLVFELAQVGQHLVYIFLIKTLIDKRTNTTFVNNQWIKNVWYFFLVYAISFSAGTLSFRYLEVGMPDYIFYILISSSIYLIGYYGYSQRDFFNELQTGTKPKYLYSTITNEESERLYERIIEYLKVKNIYLRNRLRINELARELDVPINQVSRAINENYQGSFSDLINAMRVNRAKELLDDHTNNDKLFAIALDSGFSNKVSFYKNFKHVVGKSPSEYREEMRSKQTI